MELSGNSTDIAQIKEIINAAAGHDVDRLEVCLREYSFKNCESVDIQDPDSGHSPLHAAIASCQVFANISSESQNGTSNQIAVRSRDDIESDAQKTVQCLLENGAIWNQLDLNNETPGCIAYRLGFENLYTIMVDAGVRAEMLLNRLDGYQELIDDETQQTEIIDDDSKEQEQELSSAGIEDVNSKAYLSSTLSLSEDKLLDDKDNGVMMAWESDIMLKSADALLQAPSLTVLNIGFGMGIIDTHIQSHRNKPANHHIIEAHPDILDKMKQKGWYDKTGVFVHEGRWQDVLPRLIAENEAFDAIYYDTFAESYSDFKDFFSENVIALLSQSGKWSFFNGMGADRQISYDVYQKVAELDLFEAGFDIVWQDIELPQLDKEWEGVRRKYWNVNRYRLPICSFME